jgi:hypothetical protein
MNIKNSNQNSLEELIALVSQIKDTLHDFSHVTEYLPKSLTSQIEGFEEKLMNEYDSRVE